VNEKNSQFVIVNQFYWGNWSILKKMSLCWLGLLVWQLTTTLSNKGKESFLHFSGLLSSCFLCCCCLYCFVLYFWLIDFFFIVCDCYFSRWWFSIFFFLCCDNFNLALLSILKTERIMFTKERMCERCPWISWPTHSTLAVISLIHYTSVAWKNKVWISGSIPWGWSFFPRKSVKSVMIQMMFS